MQHPFAYITPSRNTWRLAVFHRVTNCHQICSLISIHELVAQWVTAQGLQSYKWSYHQAEFSQGSSGQNSLPQSHRHNASPLYKWDLCVPCWHQQGQLPPNLCHVFPSMWSPRMKSPCYQVPVTFLLWLLCLWFRAQIERGLGIKSLLNLPLLRSTDLRS